MLDHQIRAVGRGDQLRRHYRPRRGDVDPNGQRDQVLFEVGVAGSQQDCGAHQRTSAARTYDRSSTSKLVRIRLLSSLWATEPETTWCSHSQHPLVADLIAIRPAPRPSTGASQRARASGARPTVPFDVAEHCRVLDRAPQAVERRLRGDRVIGELQWCWQSGSLADGPSGGRASPGSGRRPPPRSRPVPAAATRTQPRRTAALSTPDGVRCRASSRRTPVITPGEYPLLITHHARRPGVGDQRTQQEDPCHRRTPGGLGCRSPLL
jgi:hypothetical protein